MPFTQQIMYQNEFIITHTRVPVVIIKQLYMIAHNVSLCLTVRVIERDIKKFITYPNKYVIYVCKV